VSANGDVSKLVVILSAGAPDDVKLRDGLALHLAPAVLDAWLSRALRGEDPFNAT
jgi:hypothetical protein